MKRRKRASTNASVPVVTKRPDGKYAVQISPCAFITWSSEPDGANRERFTVEIESSANTEFAMRETYKRTNNIITLPTVKQPVH
jgi:hypothetical protein